MNSSNQPDQAHPDNQVAVKTASLIDDPMFSVIAASLITISTLGIVLSGAWFIDMVLGKTI